MKRSEGDEEADSTINIKISDMEGELNFTVIVGACVDDVSENISFNKNISILGSFDPRKSFSALKHNVTLATCAPQHCIMSNHDIIVAFF